MAPYLLQDQQRWTMTPLKSAGGTPGSAYVKITIETTNRAMQVGDEGAINSDTFTGTDNQLWRIDQLADGSYRVMPKAIPNSRGSLALSAVGSSMPTLATFDAAGDRQRWLFKTP